MSLSPGMTAIKRDRAKICSSSQEGFYREHPFMYQRLRDSLAVWCGFLLFIVGPLDALTIYRLGGSDLPAPELSGA